MFCDLTALFAPDVPTDVSNLDHSNVDSGDDSLPLIVDEADEIEQRPGISIETTQVILMYFLRY